MTDKSAFTTDEWNQLLQSVLLSGLAITAAEPSGLFGSLKEAFASAGALAKAKADPNANELIKAVASSLASFDETSGARERVRTLLSGVKSPAEVKTRAIAALGELSTLLDRKVPGDAKPFKEWLRNVSQDVAEASSEGGFLGIGGVKVSEAEKATVADISRALNLSA
jgi:hypothetical protein